MSLENQLADAPAPPVQAGTHLTELVFAGTDTAANLVTRLLVEW
jgi:hypothetical protein